MKIAILADYHEASGAVSAAAMHDASPEHESPTPPNSTPGHLRSTHQAEALLLRETQHRCSNDLQLVVSLLALQSRRAVSAEAREALADATERVAILARARSSLHQQVENTLEAALRQVCEGLQSQAGPRGILISLEVDSNPCRFPPDKVMSVALTVNELITNAVKHAFEEGKTGFVRISLRQQGHRHVTILVDDDGLPFPEIENGAKGNGLGLDLAKRLIAAIGGILIVPGNGSKLFELRLPLDVA